MSYLEKLEKIIAKQGVEKDRQPDTTSSNFDHIIQLRLSELARHNIALKIYSDILACEVWLCSNVDMAAKVKRDDPEGFTYTVDELRQLIKLNPISEDIKRNHNAKSVFNGSRILETKPESLK